MGIVLYHNKSNNLMYSTQSQIISKEDIKGLSLRSAEVLDTENAIRKRKADLYKAMILGNVYHVKCKIIFLSDSEFYKVETTVWAATDNYVTLKGGTIIPVKSILEVIV
jgi:hypothetical protein